MKLRFDELPKGFSGYDFIDKNRVCLCTEDYFQQILMDREEENAHSNDN